MIVDTAILVGIGFVCYMLVKIFGVLHMIHMRLQTLVKLA